jgi:hypothetical protein
MFFFYIILVFGIIQKNILFAEDTDIPRDYTREIIKVGENKPLLKTRVNKY